MADPMTCPGCRREFVADERMILCTSCGRTLRPSLIPPGPRLAPLLDALPAEDDRVTTRRTPPRETPEPPPTRPRLNAEVIESKEARARSKGGIAVKIGLGLLCVLGGGIWFGGGLAFGMFFKYPIVLLIGGVGLIIDGLRRRER